MAAEQAGQKRALDLEDEVLCLEDVLEEHDAMEEEACAVLGGSDPERCSYPQGYIKRQALYACSTCTPKGGEAAGICLACSYKCHEGHDLLELYTKRNFRCDCGNTKFKNVQCKLYSDKDKVNILNKYDDNFFGLYCICKRPYPDPEDETPDEMIQCVVCEDWFHERHLGASPEENMEFQEMVCPACMKLCPFLWAYAAHLSVPTVTKVSPLDDSSGDLKVEVTECKTESTVIENGAGLTSDVYKISHIGIMSKEDTVKEESIPCNGPSTSKTTSNGDACPIVKMEHEGTTCKLKNLTAHQVLKGETATYWPLNWRSKLCACKHCQKMYSELDLPFLLDEFDTVVAYETKGKSDNATRQDPLMSALSNMDRVQQVELIYEYNDMKTELKDYLKRFAEEGKMSASRDPSSDSDLEFLPEDPPQRKVKEHFIWKFFTFPKGEKKCNAAKVTCRICDTTLSRGDPTRKYSFGNANLIRHVERRHPNNFARESTRDLARNPPRDGRSTSTGAATPSGRAAAHLIPNVQPVFADLKIVCQQCDQLLCYGEQCIELIVRRKEEHRCSTQP